MCGRGGTSSAARPPAVHWWGRRRVAAEPAHQPEIAENFTDRCAIVLAPSVSPNFPLPGLPRWFNGFCTTSRTPNFRLPGLPRLVQRLLHHFPLCGETTAGMLDAEPPRRTPRGWRGNPEFRSARFLPPGWPRMARGYATKPLIVTRSVSEGDSFSSLSSSLTLRVTIATNPQTRLTSLRSCPGGSTASAPGSQSES